MEWGRADVLSITCISRCETLRTRETEKEVHALELCNPRSCPNCHSLTPNFRSKKLKNKIHTSKERLLEEIKTGGSIREILKRLDLDGSGGNYKRIYKICKEQKINIPKKLSTKPLTGNKIQNKIEELQYKINEITKVVNFDKKGWRIEVSKILNISPQAVKQWMIREMPEYYKKCWSHKDNKE